MSYDSGLQPLNCACLLLYYAMCLCTVHAESVMHHACIMFSPCPPPIFKMFMLSENEKIVTDILIAIDISEIYITSLHCAI